MPVTNTTAFAVVAKMLPHVADEILTGGGLHNGNIRAMLVNIPKLGDAKLYGYRYDQLNRIVGMNTYNGLTNATNVLSAAGVDDYRERVAYDANGNIKTYFRNRESNAAGTSMDDLTYQYERTSNGKLSSNRLRYVHDQVVSSYTEDLETQTSLSQSQVLADNTSSQTADYYQYDAIGNLVQEGKSPGEVLEISWTVYGKIASITKSTSPSQPIIYTYDANGNRISKTIGGRSTWYVRDASGNVMSVYEDGNSQVNTGDMTQVEVHLYGSSRLGVLNFNRNIENPGNGGNLERGNKFFELSNHLGNVLVTITDRKLQVQDPNNTSNTLYHNAEIATANDYYPFGMGMPGRKFSAGSGYRYGVNGKERENDLANDNYDFGDRFFDGRTGRWLSLDPLQTKFPGLSPYNYCYNSPITYYDDDGKVGIEVHVEYNNKTGKYTILSLSISDDLYRKQKARSGGATHCWYDYIKIVTVPSEPSGRQTTEIILGDHRFETTFLMTKAKWFAKMMVNDGFLEDASYGGIMWTSSDQTAGSEETRRGKPSFISNVDDLALFVDATNRLLSHKFEKKDLLEVLGKISELIKEVTQPQVADIIDKGPPTLESLTKKLDDILAKYNSEPTGSSSQAGAPKPPPVEITLPEREGEGWQYYYHNPRRSGRISGDTDSVVNGGVGKPDTIFKRPYKEPPKPKRDIPRKKP